MGKTKKEQEETSKLFERGLRKCSKCGVLKGVADFYKASSSKYGLQVHCKECPKNKEYQARKDKREDLIKKGLKNCTKCKLIKPLDNFHKKGKGYFSKCKDCERLRLGMKKRGEKYTKQYCHTVAMAYTSKGVFYTESAAIYDYAKKYGWLDEICSHMNPAVYGLWSPQKVYAACLNKETRPFFYIILCSLEEEIFLKLGITSEKYIETRYSNDTHMPYYYETIIEIYSPKHNLLEACTEIWDMEQELKNALKNYHYIPDIKFRGSYSECFEIDAKALESPEGIITFIKQQL